MITQWDEKYSLNNPKIDEQHKELFRLSAMVDLLNEKTTKKEIRELLNTFFDYMKEHFNDEEAYMKSINYPLLSKHKKLHQKIIDDFVDLIKKNSSLNELKAEMKKATKKWLIEHILENDLKIERWRKANS